MKINRRNLLVGALTSGATYKLSAQTVTPLIGIAEPDQSIDLWPHGAPGQPLIRLNETVIERSENPALMDRAVVAISQPRLMVFRPKVVNGAAVLITPGGGYQRVVVDKEGYQLGRWLSARGFTVFVLLYRLPHEGWAAGAEVCLSDAQRAMRLIRSHAKDYAIDPERVASMDFSAGGHLCADLATRFDTKTYSAVDSADELSARPSVAAPIYPVISMSSPLAHAGSRKRLIGNDATLALEKLHSPHLNVTEKTPPFFLIHAEDDSSVVVENSLVMREALKAKGIAVEMHLFVQGGHGFGLPEARAKLIAIWPELFLAWAKTQELI